LDECYRVWQSFDHHDQRCIRELLATIITGQMDDLEQFPENTVTALPDAAATERYTYLVAGCVGEFWTKMCRAHLPGMAGLDAAQGIRFGQGLQLVNILRDLPRDLRLGRCYLPVTDPARFLEPGNFPLLEPIYRQWLERAAEHLDAGWEYTLSIPASQKRLRLACVWPIWIGRKTIDRLRRANPLAADQRVKVSRWEVYAIIAESALLVGNDAGLDEADRRLRTGM
jgi:farnesyl-diphosphate farnesyltransferase